MHTRKICLTALFPLTKDCWQRKGDRKCYHPVWVYTFIIRIPLRQWLDLVQDWQVSLGAALSHCKTKCKSYYPCCTICNKTRVTSHVYHLLTQSWLLLSTHSNSIHHLHPNYCLKRSKLVHECTIMRPKSILAANDLRASCVSVQTYLQDRWYLMAK